MKRTILSALVGLFAMGMAGTALAETDTNTLRITTGSDSGVYYKVGNTFASTFGSDSLAVEVMTSNGGLANLERLARGEADAAIVQADHWVLFNRRNGTGNFTPYAELYPEYVHVICNTDWAEENAIGDLYDVEHTGATMVMLSGGSAATWENIGLEDSDYADLPLVDQPMNYGELGLLNISTGQYECGFYVAGIGAGLLHTAGSEFGGTLTLVEAADDGDFNDAEAPDGSRLYTYAGYDDSRYDNGSKDFSVIFDYDTISVTAIMVFRTEWVQQNFTEFRNMIKNRSAFMDAVQELVRD